jgi:hypothetical protein
MADGSFIVHGRVITGLEANRMSLEDATGAGHVVTRCPRCRHRESTDVSWWMRSKTERGHSLDVLSRRLRCLCGCKDVALEVWPVAPALNEATPRTFHWRA